MKIIGCGNYDRGDDAAGLIVARVLRERGVGAVGYEGDGAGLLELWSVNDDVVLVDAMRSRQVPGTVRVWDALAEVLPLETLNLMSHAFGAGEAIRLARVLGRTPRSLVVYGIEVESCAFGAPMSAPVVSAVQSVTAAIIELHS